MKSSLIDSFRSDERHFLNLSLAAAFLFLWFVFDGFRVQIALSRVHLELAVTDLRWQPQWPLLPWLTGAVSLLLAYGRLRFPRLAAWGNEDLAPRLRLVGTFTAALLVIRLTSLWQPVTYLFPFLGVLWAPHSTWGLCLLYLLFLHFPFSTSARSSSRLTDGWVAALLLIVGATVYGCYTLYFCQITMLHGDEGQYLRVTQSLLHDGDMYLANNLDREQTDEFHVLDFAVNQSPGSPPGKVHSQHPIGLSIGLLPAYWMGLELWQNPRLAAALCVALMAAACLPVAFLWLRRLGVNRPLALLGVGILGITSPFFLYSNQLYPEIPALLITFVVLLALTHWQVPGGGYQSWGRPEPLFLGLMLLLLACLPFLHPRYTPIVLLGGVLLLLQSWHSPQRLANLVVLGLAAALALSAQLTFNLALSGDWMGLFRPENYQGKEALDITTWGVSLPGHWLHAGKGILNSSPVFLFSLLGCAAVVLARDRRLLLIGGLYLATAATNGLHPAWDLGFGYPARFMVTSMPVLLYGLVLALPLVARSRVALFLAAITLVISLETVGNTAALTELGYDGRNLMTREINQFYPWQIHFFPDLNSSLPLFDLFFWSILLAALFFLLVYPRPIPPAVRAGITLLAALLPFIWGRSDGITNRLDAGASLYTSDLTAGNATRELGLLRHTLHPEPLGTGMRESDGRLVARSPAHSQGYMAKLPPAPAAARLVSGATPRPPCPGTSGPDQLATSTSPDATVFLTFPSGKTASAGRCPAELRIRVTCSSMPVIHFSVTPSWSSQDLANCPFRAAN